MSWYNPGDWAKHFPINGKNIRGVLEDVTGYSAAEEMADAQKKAYSEQISNMREMSQWGYGYPEWMLTALQDQVASGKLDASELEDMYKKMKDLYTNQSSTLGPLQDVVKKYVAGLNTGNVTQNYTDMAKNAWNKSYSALGEIPGMTSGQRLSTLAGLEGEYGNALTQAQLAGEQERINRLGLAYGAESGLANQQSQEQMIMQELARQYAGMGMSIPGAQQALMSDPLRTSMALSNRYPGTTTPPLSAPSSGAYMGAWAGQQGMDLIKTYMGGQGTGSTGTTINFPMQTQSGTNPYGTLPQGYNPNPSTWSS